MFTFQVPLRIIFKNENSNEDMVSILQQFFSYLSKKGDGGVDGQLFSSDKLTVETAVHAISSVVNGFTPEDHLEGINLQLGDWYAAVKVLSGSAATVTVPATCSKGNKINMLFLVEIDFIK